MKIERDFVLRATQDRDAATVGRTVLELRDGRLWLDGTELPEASQRHLLTFALQTLQDAYAGANGTEEARGLWEKKREKLLNGTIGARGARGEAVPLETQVWRDVARQALRDRGAKDPVWVRFKGLKPEEQAAKLDGLVEQNRKALKPAFDLAMQARTAKVEIEVDF